MMLTTPVASQKKAFPLVGTLNRLSLSESETNPLISEQLKVSNTDAQNLNYETSVVPEASNLYQSPEYNGDYRSAKYSAQQTPLKNGNSPSLTKHEQYSGSGKEKGSIHSATLWDYSDGSALDFLRWRRLISPCAAAIKNPAVLSPSSLTFSMDSKSSRGNLTDTCSDLLFLLPVAITESYTIRWCSVCTIIFLIQSLTWCSLVDTLVVFTLNVSWCIHGNAPQCSNTGRASNHNVNEAYTMALQHSTQTRPKFQYLFLAVCRSDLNATPHRESVTAHSEQDARRSLAGQFVLSFAGRIPAQGVCNA
ncbi:host cell division inhibitor Icd-like protein [Yersinia sp. 2545 StPb PI]|uniref:host cell division inhibitor Icd-like protein n=1 Tax=Yersinia sp. 2545 StPb PI TaxID=3117410 RepID=UPI003FA43B9D